MGRHLTHLQHCLLDNGLWRNILLRHHHMHHVYRLSFLDSFPAAQREKHQYPQQNARSPCQHNPMPVSNLFQSLFKNLGKFRSHIHHPFFYHTLCLASFSFAYIHAYRCRTPAHSDFTIRTMSQNTILAPCRPPPDAPVAKVLQKSLSMLYNILDYIT